MKTTVSVLALAGYAAASPIDKIITMLGDLETAIVAEDEDAHKVYAEFAEWCEDTSKDPTFGAPGLSDCVATSAPASSDSVAYFAPGLHFLRPTVWLSLPRDS